MQDDSMMESDARPAGAEDPSLRRACDQCRTRKIRCDRTSPCSNCRIAMRACSSIGVSHKPKEQRNRVLISHQYERKIDLIEERLAGIEDALRTIAVNGVATGPSKLMTTNTPPTAASTVMGEPSSNATNDDSDSDSAFEGDLSLTAHTAFAHDFLEQAVERTSLSDLTPSMQAALSSLRQMVSLQHRSSSTREHSFPFQKPLPPGGLADMQMPPMNTVMSMLKLQKASPPSVFTIACSFLDLDDLVDLCRKVYFCTEPFSHASFIIVNGALYYLFMEQSCMTRDPAAKEEFTQYLHMCQVNLESAMASAPLMMPAKMESIMALLVGGLYAIGVSKPSLAWHFISTAATLCQTLGYHRPSRNKPEMRGSRDVRTLLFWHTYVFDKSLALRTGRCSVLQDWDITIPRKVDSTMVEDPWGPILTNWIKEAALQHNIYELLYSPAALKQPLPERVERARRLEAEQKDIMAAGSQLREQALFGFKSLNASFLIDVHLKGDELSYQSTLTLIYRALPAPEGSPSRFTTECIETARFAMQIHHECMDRLADEKQHLKAVHVHWAIMTTPFAPFFVLFCHVVETSSTEDMKRLCDFVDSLRPACAFSDAVERLLQLCQVLYNVALLYVEAKALQPEGQAQVNEEMDRYLSALGFPPNEFLPPTTTGVDPRGSAQQARPQADQLGNWFSGNQHIMGLLEQDLLPFNQNGWMP